MKTVLEQVIFDLFDGNPPQWAELIIKEGLEAEKEQMCKFASDYVETQCNASFDGSVSVDITTEEYYNLTFKSE